MKAAFTWIDTDTGETAGPYNIVASGANGTDKSCASALALAERYFLLKFFHFTTHDPDDEPDAHDSDTIPGIPRETAVPAMPAQAAKAQPAAGGQYPAYGQGFGGYPVQQAQQPGQQVNVYAAAPTYNPPAAPQQGWEGFNENNPLIRSAIEKLMNFDANTVSHQQVLNECVGMLSANGILCTDPSFIKKLTEAAQARRENRSTRF